MQHLQPAGFPTLTVNLSVSSSGVVSKTYPLVRSCARKLRVVPNEGELHEAVMNSAIVEFEMNLRD